MHPKNSILEHNPVQLKGSNQEHHQPKNTMLDQHQKELPTTKKQECTYLQKAVEATRTKVILVDHPPLEDHPLLEDHPHSADHPPLEDHLAAHLEDHPPLADHLAAPSEDHPHLEDHQVENLLTENPPTADLLVANQEAQEVPVLGGN